VFSSLRTSIVVEIVYLIRNFRSKIINRKANMKCIVINNFLLITKKAQLIEPFDLNIFQ